jgi:hypothetical protein
VFGCLLGLVLTTPVHLRAAQVEEAAMTASAAVDADSRRLLFIHHSCGGQLLAAPGERAGGEAGSGERCIYVTHPNGGDLRAGLEAAGFEVHELSYESQLGEDTDIGHWRRKFTERLDDLLHTDRQDLRYPDGRRNGIVVFKSCYPNNAFVGPGEAPGDPDVPVLTIANAKAAYASLLTAFAAQPEVLFVAFTAPPQAEPAPDGLLGRLKALFRPKPKTAQWAREFNTWLADERHGWLAEYPAANVAVFDYYDILTGDGRSDWSAYPTGGGRDSHPSREGNARAAAAFVPFLEQALARQRSAD